MNLYRNFLLLRPPFSVQIENVILLFIHSMKLIKPFDGLRLYVIMSFCLILPNILTVVTAVKSE